MADIEQIINSLNDELDRLGKAISEARKQGKDTKMAELLAMGIHHKIRFAEISEDQKDIAKAKSLLAKARQELDQSQEKLGKTV